MDRYMTQNSPPNSDALTTSQIVLSRQRTGKKMRRDRAKVVRDNKKLLKKGYCFKTAVK